jgi:hypothetical protein
MRLSAAFVLLVSRNKQSGEPCEPRSEDRRSMVQES